MTQPAHHTHALLIVNGQGDVKTHMTGTMLNCKVIGMSVQANANGWRTHSIVPLPSCEPANATVAVYNGWTVQDILDHAG